MNRQQYDRMRSGRGFVAALDQSGGSTPKALRLYGVESDRYSGEDEMFALIHQMRRRIMTDPAFTADRIIATILFEQTMERQIEQRPTASYLWDVKGIVPILKVDKGLEPEADGVQVMKPMPELAGLLDRAKANGVFVTKMRSVIRNADSVGVAEVVDQQFEVARTIIDADLVPIIEPEVAIDSPTKAVAEALLRTNLRQWLDSLPDGQVVMLKLTMPTQPDFYRELTQHPRVLRVVGLSGGYSRDEAVRLLAENHGMIASFSRALTEGLTEQQSDDEFHRTLDTSIQQIYEASLT